MLYRKWGSNNDEVIKYTSSINSDKEIFQEVKLVMKAHVIELYLDKIINKEISKKILDAIIILMNYQKDMKIFMKPWKIL